MSTNENNGNILDPKSKSGVKAARAKQQELEEKKKATTNKIIGSIAAVLVIGLVLFNQGVFTSTSPALTVNGVSYSTDQVEMYYMDGLYTALFGGVEPGEGGVAYDMSLPADEQFYGSNPFMTWHDYFVEEAVKKLGEIHLISDLAMSEGFQLPAEALEEIDSTRFSLETAWIGYYPNQKTYMRGQFGEDMTVEIYMDMVTREQYANHYQTEMYDNFSFSQDELEEYYLENRDDLDMLTFSLFYFPVMTLTVAVDEETGEEIEPTEEQIESFNADKEAQSVLADEMIAAFEGGATLEEVTEQFAGQYAYSHISEEYVSSTVVDYPYGSWILEEDRVKYDTYKTGTGEGYSATYVVTVFEGRERLDEVTANIRHIYLAANEEETPTEEEWEAAEVRAEEMLELWIADGSDLDDFAALAEEHSADSGSAANGGILTDVTTLSGYVDTFTEWATNPARQPGDTGIVKNEGSAVAGYHIMYFESWGEPIWKLDAEDAVKIEAMDSWKDEITGSLETAIIRLNGLNDVELVSLF